MEVKNILVVSPMYKEIKSLVEKEKINKEFRYLVEAEMVQDDLLWADAFVSFNVNSSYDYSHIKWVHSLGAGVDKFLHNRDWPDGVLLTRTICSFGQRIAEYCLGYILKDVQFHDEFHELQKQRNWSPITPKLISDQKVMIYGTGEIGQNTAKILSGFGAEVYGVSLSGIEKEYFNEVMTVDSHFSQLNEMNYLINTLPLTEQTVKLFDGELFNKLSNVGFINVGRGATVDEEALIQALSNQQLKFAVLDVFTQEPLPEDHRFWSHPNIHITPHISAVTTPEEGVACFLETLKNIDENKPLKNIVDVKKGY
ncbi:MAG: D-isomer specific 2-hydroxyacid dehydrogenase [Neobacillus sp.]|jgi:phosphoglycerate dehydrogenase-like enzyme|nr:D-isomer specific 2-hydroxyacid dehydrogenase [Neobacillus sp.]